MIHLFKEYDIRLVASLNLLLQYCLKAFCGSIARKELVAEACAWMDV